MTSAHAKVAVDVTATGILIGVLIEWLTAISLILTIIWWAIRYWESITGRCLSSIGWVKKLAKWIS